MLWLVLSGVRPLFPLFSTVLVDCQTSPELPGGSSLERWLIRGRQRTRCNIVTVAHNKHVEETDTVSEET